MDAYLFGNLTIKNIDTRTWTETAGTYLDMRLGFNKYANSIGSEHVMDLMSFRHQWSMENIREKTGWNCIDGYVNETHASYNNHILWKAKTFNSYYNAGADSQNPDDYQDCIVNNN